MVTMRDIYKDLPQKWRSRKPMREVYVVDRESEGR